MEEKKCIGIDLGTTNSVMCIMHTKPQIILNRENDFLTPSTVAHKKSKKAGDTVLVGKLAQNYAKIAGKNYLYSVKRLIGRSFDDKEVQKMKKSVSYEIVASPDGDQDVVHVKMGDGLYAPKEISAKILKKLKEDAEFRENTSVDSAVITVPAYFSERQKHATRQAGLLAGLKVKKVIDEPSAAAIAYGIDKNDDTDKMVLVFDLGGGTFDVSILLMYGGTFQQMCNEGDMWLGGDDFDRLIMERIIRQIEADEELENLHENAAFMHELKKEACNAKEILTTQESADIIISDTLKDETGMPIPIEYEITRSEFERMIEPYVTRSIEIVEKAMREESLTKDDIDTVLMVGGSSSIPKFQEAMEKKFGKEKIMRGIDPMTCVAQGAGIIAKSLDDRVWCTCGQENQANAEVCEKCGNNLSVVHKKPVVPLEAIGGVTAKPYGIEIDGDRFETILKKGLSYPTEEPRVKEFKTLVADQRIIKIPVREGSSPKASENEFMGNIWFTDLPPGLPQGTPVDISIDLDEDMVFTIGCKVRGADWSRTLELQHGGWQNPVLDKAMEANFKVIRGEILDSQVKKKVEELVDDIQKDVNKGDKRSAKEHLKKLENALEEPPPSVDWKIHIENVLTLAKIFWDRIRSVFPEDHEIWKAAEDWIRDAQSVLDDNDREKGEEFQTTGINRLLDVPLVGESVLSVYVEQHPNLAPALAMKLQQEREKLLKAFDRKNGDAISQSIPAFRECLKEAMDSTGDEGLLAPGEVLVTL